MMVDIQVGIPGDLPTWVSPRAISEVRHQISTDHRNIADKTWNTLPQGVDQAIVRASRVAIPLSIILSVDAQLGSGFVEELPRQLRQVWKHSLCPSLRIQKLLHIGCPCHMATSLVVEVTTRICIGSVTEFPATITLTAII